MKKTLATVALGAIVTISCIPLAACGGKYSETYNGTVSEETYTTKDDAVKGYLDEEISGKTTNAVLVNYKVEKELSQKEIDKLELDEKYTTDLKKAEELSVEYKEESSSLIATAYAVSESQQTTSVRTMYILSYTDMFRFFTPAMKEGESLSASYYDSTFEAEKYINCTMNAEITASVNYDGLEMSLTNTALAKVTETSLYELDKVVASGMPDTFPEYLTNGEYTLECYAADTSQGIYATVKESGDTTFCQPVRYPTYETITSYFMKWFDDRFGQLDHTFFEKTKTGYALRKDKFEEFASNQTIFSNGLPTDGASEFEYLINIKDGRMADISISVSYMGTINTMTVKFSDFGTTEIAIPDDIKSQMPV